MASLGVNVIHHYSLEGIFTVTYILIYVDDVLITGNDVHFIDSLKQKLNTEFALKDLGLLIYFVGVEVTYAEDGTVHLSQ